MATQSPGRKRQLESEKKASTPLFNKLGSVIKKLFGRKNKKGETSKVDSKNTTDKKSEMRDSEADYSTTSSSPSPTSTTDSGLSFKQAFAKAREEKGAGETFPWNGKIYSTNRADDVKTNASVKSNANGGGGIGTNTGGKPGITNGKFKPKGNMAHMAIPEPEYPAAPTVSDVSPFNLSPKAKEDSGGYEYVKGPGRDNKRRIKVPKGKYPGMIGYDG